MHMLSMLGNVSTYFHVFGGLWVYGVGTHTLLALVKDNKYTCG